jgi:hypothetical protein
MQATDLRRATSLASAFAVLLIGAVLYVQNVSAAPIAFEASSPFSATR